MSAGRPLETTYMRWMREGGDEMDEEGTGQPGRGYFKDDNHALRAGWVFGTLAKAELMVQVEQDEKGNYTDVMRLDVAGHVVRLRVLPKEEES